jgi:hypothetical protein
MLCSNCEHFKQPTSFNAPYGECLLAAGQDGESQTPDAFAYASDGESYSARLNVLPSFGCNQFAAQSRKPLDVSAGPNWARRNDSPRD